MPKFTPDEKRECVEREFKLRIAAYPGWIEKGKMNWVTAVRELALMESIVEDYRRLSAQTRLDL